MHKYGFLFLVTYFIKIIFALRWLISGLYYSLLALRIISVCRVIRKKRREGSMYLGNYHIG